MQPTCDVTSEDWERSIELYKERMLKNEPGKVSLKEREGMVPGVKEAGPHLGL